MTDERKTSPYRRCPDCGNEGILGPHYCSAQPMTDERTARIEAGIAQWAETNIANNALADLRAWQEIAERHVRDDHLTRAACNSCGDWRFPCDDRKLADAALDRLDRLWGTA